MKQLKKTPKGIIHKKTKKNEKLTKKVETNEIREAIQNMENGKSPGGGWHSNRILQRISRNYNFRFTKNLQ